MKGAGTFLIAFALVLVVLSATPGASGVLLMAGAAICLVAGIVLISRSAVESNRQYAEEYQEDSAAEARLTKLRDDGNITEEQYREQRERRF